LYRLGESLFVRVGRQLLWSSREADDSKLFGEDDEAGEEGELDKAKAEGENGKLASSLPS